MRRLAKRQPEGDGGVSACALNRANALACCPPISSRAVFPSAFLRFAAGSLAPIVGSDANCRLYGIGVVLLAVTSLAITLFRPRRAYPREHEHSELEIVRALFLNSPTNTEAAPRLNGTALAQADGAPWSTVIVTAGSHASLLASLINRRAAERSRTGRLLIAKLVKHHDIKAHHATAAGPISRTPLVALENGKFRYPVLAPKFPVIDFEFPVRFQKFPVPIIGKFLCKPLKLAIKS